jgi:hypothetical protein
MEESKLGWLRWKLGLPNMVAKDTVGQSGGLAIFWKNEVNVRLVGFKSRYHLDTENTERDGFVWRFTGIYGDPSDKENTWRLLRTLKHQNDQAMVSGWGFQ